MEANIFVLSLFHHLGLRDFYLLSVLHLLLFIIPFDAQIYPNVSSGIPIKLVLLVLQTFLHESWSKFFAKFDVQDSNRCFSVSDLELGVSLGSVFSNWDLVPRVTCSQECHYFLPFQGQRYKMYFFLKVIIWCWYFQFKFNVTQFFSLDFFNF